MTDAKLDQAGVAGKRIAGRSVDRWSDWTAKAAVVIVYGGSALMGVATVPRLVPPDNIHDLLTVAARIANVLFLGLVVLATVTRLAPIMKSQGIETRVSALLGTFLSIALAFLPKAELGPIWSAVSTILILVGISLSIVVVRWLGKSFSIQAEARHLVTEGPYGIVRHPLYLCEGIALIGMTLQVLSPLAVLVAIMVVTNQCRRMINEERILRQAFPEYAVYAAATPFLIPARPRRSANQAGEELPTKAIDPQV